MRKLSCILLIAISLFGCKKAYIQFGSQFVDNGYTNIVLVDTMTPLVTTIFRDSVATSNSGILLSGSYMDSLFGNITTKSFFKVAPPFTKPTFASSALFDSLRLILRPNGSYYGDTTVNQPISINQLAEIIQFGETQTSLYNTSNFAVQPNPIGGISRRFYPSDSTRFSVPMSDAVGQNLFNLLVNQADEVANEDNFVNYFKGLQISAGDQASSAVFGFKDSAVMRLYYHEASPSPVSKFVDFSFTGANLQFNQIHFDRTGTPVAILNHNNPEVESSQMGNMGFIQTATGLVAKIRFPYLRNILQRPDYAQILKGELDVQPVRGTYSGKYPLPPQLEAYTTSVLNIPEGPLTIGSGASVMIQNGNLQVDWLYGQNTFYSYDVTAYLQQQIAISDNNKNGLLIQPPTPQFQSALNRLVFGDKDVGQYKLTLKLYYISIQP